MIHRRHLLASGLALPWLCRGAAAQAPYRRRSATGCMPRSCRSSTTRPMSRAKRCRVRRSAPAHRRTCGASTSPRSRTTARSCRRWRWSL